MSKETPDLSGLLGNLLSNPGALSALSGILGNLGGQSERQPPPEEPTHTEKPEEKAELTLPTMLPFAAKGGGHRDREGLLGALRPYLSPRRCQALEGACKLLEVIDLFRSQRKEGHDV